MINYELESTITKYKMLGKEYYSYQHKIKPLTMEDALNAKNFITVITDDGSLYNLFCDDQGIISLRSLFFNEIIINNLTKRQVEQLVKFPL